MCRHIHNWDIAAYDVKQPISLTHVMMRLVLLVQHDERTYDAQYCGANNSITMGINGQHGNQGSAEEFYAAI